MIHKRIMSLYGNITRSSSDSVEYQLAKRQLEVKSFTIHSWFIAVKKILIKYNLPDPETLLENPVEKLNWKKKLSILLSTNSGSAI